MRRCLLCVALCVALGALACDEETKTTPDSATTEAGVPDLAMEAPSSVCQATTASGPVIGVEGAKHCAYLGIPYAKPPVDALRWKPPQKPDPWTAPLLATKDGNVCPPAGSCCGTVDEDCLSLNVWAPTASAAKPRPVLVWIHQGRWMFGGSSTRWSKADKLVEEQDLVVVSFNFRMAALGFLVHPALGSDSGNYGFLDQVHALQWVRDNIAAFGGDPNNVTLAGGNQHGGASVCAHMVSKKSKGLFHRAIMHSGTCIQNLPPGPVVGPILTRAQAEAQGKKLAAYSKIQCDTAADVAACLRAAPPDELNNALSIFTSKPKVGADAFWGVIMEPGGVLEDTPLNLVKKGALESPVPVLLGVGLLEAGEDFYGQELMAAQGLIDRVTANFGPLASAILAQYSPYTTPAIGPCQAPCAASIHLNSDLFWNCGARNSAIGLAAAGGPTYLYELAFPNWKSITRPDGVPFEAYCGGSRWSALTYLFHSEHPGDKTCNVKWLFSAEEQQLAKELRGYWARFARTGDPNGAGAVTWPTYDAATDQHLVLDAPISTGTGLHKTNCDFWASLE